MHPVFSGIFGEACTPRAMSPAMSVVRKMDFMLESYFVVRVNNLRGRNAIVLMETILAKIVFDYFVS